MELTLEEIDRRTNDMLEEKEGGIIMKLTELEMKDKDLRIVKKRIAQAKKNITDALITDNIKYANTLMQQLNELIVLEKYLSKEDYIQENY